MSPRKLSPMFKQTLIACALQAAPPGAKGLMLTGHALNTASQYANRSNTLDIPSWTRLDLGARYLTTIGNKLVIWRAHVDNVTDRNYWVSLGALRLLIPTWFVVLGSGLSLWFVRRKTNEARMEKLIQAHQA